MRGKLNDKALLELYLVQKISSVKIALMFNVRVSSVCRRLQKYDAIRSATGHDGRNGKDGVVLLNGYPVLYLPKHPRAKSNGYVREHIVIAENYLGRPLNAQEVIHHINGDKTDNRTDNLMLFPSNSEHMKFHWKERNGIALPCAEYVIRMIKEEV